MQVLTATMFQKDLSLIERMKIRDRAIVINQTDYKKYPKLSLNDEELLFISTEERGLSRSRNMALAKASDDICILADDDVEYMDRYNEVVKEAYLKYPDADLILFDYYKEDSSISSKIAKKAGKVTILPALKANSIRITFKRKSIINNGIKFNEYFGSGSEYFTASEDIVFIADCFKNNLNLYYEPIPILKLKDSQSTWFKGYNSDFFESLGAFAYHWLNDLWFLFVFQFIVRHISDTRELGLTETFISMKKGKEKYKKLLNEKGL